jgi:nucleoside-triphosphatase
MRLFLTGNPGVGKTTVIRVLAEQLKEIACAGFYTEEVRREGKRTGFRIITLDGQQATLASLGTRKPTVGKYSIHLDEFEKLAVRSLDPVKTPADLYIIDEIGKMELLSIAFKTALLELLAHPTNILATITRRGNGFVDQIKRRGDVDLIEVTRNNRDELPRKLAAKLKIHFGK